jgi:nucleoside-diphosphate-sugar epimerase
MQESHDNRPMVLVTGAFGNIGTSTVNELLRQGYPVRCFDLRTKANEKSARRFRGRVEVTWGDLRRPADLEAALRDVDVVVHLAFIIPKLSATGSGSETRPDWAREVNVGGTQNLLEAMKALPNPPKILFASSCAVYGQTQDQLPPRTIVDPVQPFDHYGQHKVQCERMICLSGLDWAILRLAASLPLAMKLDSAMFDVPLHNRIEYVHTRDVGLAFANAVGSPDVWGRVLLIGGGPQCQHTYRQIAAGVLKGLGVGMLPEKAFASTPYVTDWLDTTESQKLLHYQRRTLENYVRDMSSALGFRRVLVRVFRPLVRSALLKQSPYLRADRPASLKAALQGLKTVTRRPSWSETK